MPREIGSEFPWDPTALTGTGPSVLPARHELFATGCGALSSLLRRLAPRGRLHVPSYFCTGVAEALSAVVPIAWYRHLPDGYGPHWPTLRAAPGDVVLAQNLFGHDSGAPWKDWIRDHPNIPVIEDHSHDPVSDWARSSTASYAMASLRKTLPVPDGGLVWSPRGFDLPAPDGPESHGAQLKLAAMLLKAAWLDGRSVPKDAFRSLQQQGEQLLLGSSGPASTVTQAVLPLLDVAGLRAASIAQAHALIKAVPASTSSWRVLPAGPAPFRVQLVCRTSAVRDTVLAHLAANGVYAPVHWRQNRAGFWSGDEEAADLGDRILTVPVDHRCTPADVQRIATLLGTSAVERS